VDVAVSVKVPVGDGVALFSGVREAVAVGVKVAVGARGNKRGGRKVFIKK
jgi:hypothetical protein